jgi:hypothetical protein
MSVLSLRLNEVNQRFLNEQVSSGKSKSKGVVVNYALDIYRKILLKKELMDFADNNSEEDLFWANMNPDDYLELIEKSA